VAKRSCFLPGLMGNAWNLFKSYNEIKRTVLFVGIAAGKQEPFLLFCGK